MASSFRQEREEGVLSDVLNELDRERSQRAELEAQIRLLRKKQTEEKNETSSEWTLRERIALETERDGYRQLVEALTADQPAIAAAMQHSQLPLHVIRLLEIMPYDLRAIQAAKALDEVYEWQVYQSGQWQSLLRYFPPSFRKLPIIQPKPGSSIQEATSNRLFPESPPKHCVLTDHDVTKIIKLDKGYTLPQDGGTWEWVSGWTVDKRVAVEPTNDLKKIKIDCDDEGWSYAQEIQHFVSDPTELVWDDPIAKSDGTALRPFRRRRWTRQRALRSYPQISESSLQFLKLLAENSRLQVMLTKLSHQLVETKSKLTETEYELVSVKAQTKKEIESLKLEIRSKDEESLRADKLSTPKRRGSSDFSNTFDLGKEQLDKMKTAANSFVSTAAASSALFSSRKQNDTTQSTDDESGSSSADRFEWKKMGRGGILDKFKGTTGSGGGLFQGLTPKKQEAEQEITLTTLQEDSSAAILTT
jgi:hypothetical protein